MLGVLTRRPGDRWELVEAGAGAPLLHGATLPASMTGPQACPHSTPMRLIPGLCLVTLKPLLIHDVNCLWHCMERSRARRPMTGMRQQQVWCERMHVSRNCPANTRQNNPDRSHCPYLGIHCGPYSPTVHASLGRGGGGLRAGRVMRAEQKHVPSAGV